MKPTNVTYWIFTGLLAAFMAVASIPDLLRVPQALAVFERLGYPAYLLPFLGVAKLLGVIVLLAPRGTRLKEWAYAGFAFDSVGALYSHVYVGDPLSSWWGALLGFILLLCSYAAFRLKQRAPHEPVRSALTQQLGEDAPA